MNKKQNEVETLDFEKATDFNEPDNGLVKHEGQTAIQTIDLNNGFPDLDKAEVIPFDLSSEYWTPKLAGETKRVIFDTIKISPVQDINNPEVIHDLPCAFFFEKVNGEVRTVRNGSKRLVAILQNNNIQHGSPLQIEYNGKIKNTTNNFQSDSWSVRFLNPKK